MSAFKGFVGVAAALVLGGSAAAEPTASPAPTEPTAVDVSSPASGTLSASEMADLSGGQGVEVLTAQQLTGTTTDNTINAGTLISGPVNFSENALSGFSGVGNFVINTGANNTLQGAINISVVTAAPPGP